MWNFLRLATSPWLEGIQLATSPWLEDTQLGPQCDHCETRGKLFYWFDTSLTVIGETPLLYDRSTRQCYTNDGLPNHHSTMAYCHMAKFINAIFDKQNWYTLFSNTSLFFCTLHAAWFLSLLHALVLLNMQNLKTGF